MENLIPLNIVIGDRSYRVKVAPKDEEAVRKTMRLINDKLVEFKTQFAGKDMQDYVAMVTLWYATQLQSGQESSVTAAETDEGLLRLEGLLDKVV